MSISEISNYLSGILELLRNSETSWGNISVSGTSLQTAASTTFPPNSRFAFILNDDFLDPSEVDDNVTHNPPLYTVTVSSGDEWIIKSQQRNFYVPGFDSGLGVAGQFHNVPSGNFVPDGITWEGGLGGFRSGTTTDISIVQSVERQGAVMRVQPHNAELRIYKDGDIANRLPREEWKFDPFSSKFYKFHLGRFFVLRIEYDLYGAGDFTFFLKIRDMNGESHLKEIGTIGIRDDPALKEYNLHSGVIVTSSKQVNYSAGPLEYHNEVGINLPDRTKGETLFGASVNTTVAANDETVIAVYRLQPSKTEVPVQINKLEAELVASGDEEAIAQMRQVHRNFLTFPEGVDPDDDSNWLSLGATPSDADYTASPPTSVRESAIEKLDVGENDVSISTFTDDDGQTKVRGEEESFVDVTTDSQSKQETRDIEAEAFMNEFKYLVLLGSISNTSTNFRKIRMGTAQIW